MIVSKELAYRKGFQDGVTLVTSCVSSGSSKTELGFREAWKQIEVKEAWDRKAKIRNQLVDLMISQGMDDTAAANTVDALCDSVEEFTNLADEYSLNITEGSGKEAAQV